MMKNEKKSESEIEWEKEYNLRKAKRKWLLNKKKSELLALIQDSNALSKIKVMFCVVGFVVLILFVVVVFVFLFNIFPINIKINYKEYSLELNSKDKSSSLIYISYLIHGRWNHEIFEQEVVDSLISKSGNVYFIDVGASYGMFTFLASKHKNVKSIISIEAYKPVSDRLQSNIDNNSINNVNLINS